VRPDRFNSVAIDVTLYEKQPYVAVMVYPGSRPKCKEDVARLFDWYKAELAESTVTMKLNTTVTPEMIRKNPPDALSSPLGQSHSCQCAGYRQALMWQAQWMFSGM